MTRRRPKNRPSAASIRGPGRAYASAPFHMRLVTYDRGGQRRLGAILEGDVVDLPDAVGHPAFPTTLEGLVSSSRGTVMDAARSALARRRRLRLEGHASADPGAVVPRVAAVARIARCGTSPGRPRAGRPVADRRGVARIRAEGGRRARAGDLGRRPVPQRPAPVRLHAGQRLAGARRERRPGEHRRGRADRDRAVRRDGRRDRSAGDVPAGAHRRRGDREGQPQRDRRRTCSARSRRRRELGAAGARGRARARTRSRDAPAHELWPGAEVELGAEGIGTLRNRLVRD